MAKRNRKREALTYVLFMWTMLLVLWIITSLLWFLW